MVETIFRRFLENNGILEKFEANLKKEAKVTIKGHIETLLQYGAPVWLLVDTAFTWEETPQDEGFEFWQAIDQQWESIIKKIDLKKIKGYENKLASGGDNKGS